MPPDETHAWHFYLSPGAAWAAMYDDCEKAQESIELEQYILENDPLGQKFLNLFIQKAKQGVKIKILCDRIGSHALSGSPLMTELRDSGGIFRFYNSFTFVDLLRLRRWLPRTHAKMLVVDAVAYIGGVCWAERMKDWRDTQIRIRGPVVQQIKKAISDDISAPRRFRVVAPMPASDFQYIQSEPRFFQHNIYRAVIGALCQAKQYVYISSAFFIPPRRLRRLLRQAALDGVQVVVLVPEHSDFWLADWVSLSYAPRLLKAGVRIFHYQPTVLHNKIVMVDDAWATIGSSNMDTLSFFRNRESNLIVANKDAIAEMKKDFLNDLHRSKELTLGGLKEIPLWKRMAAHVGRLFRSVL
jgi:cardiolipin synthase